MSIPRSATILTMTLLSSLSCRGASRRAAPSPATEASLVSAGRRETREGLRQATPLWPMSAFLDLPSKVWGLPDVKPGTERFWREVFQRYGLFSADSPNDGLPM